MNTSRFILLIFFWFIYVASGLMYLNVKKEKGLSSNENKYICHNVKTEEMDLLNPEKMWKFQNFREKNSTLADYVRFKTIDTINYSDFSEIFRNENLEIWYPENQYSLELQIIYEKVIRLIQGYKKCPDEPKFLFQTHLYCMVKKLLGNALYNESKKNQFSEVSKALTMFYLANNFDSNVRLRLIINIDNDLKNYELSIVRTKRDQNYSIDQYFTKKNGIKMRRKKFEEIRNKLFSKNKEDVEKELETFNFEDYKCDLFFFIQNNNQNLKVLKQLEDFNVKMEKKNEPQIVDYTFLTMNLMKDDLNKFINQEEERSYFKDLQTNDNIDLKEHNKTENFSLNENIDK